MIVHFARTQGHAKLLPSVQLCALISALQLSFSANRSVSEFTSLGAVFLKSEPRLMSQPRAAYLGALRRCLYNQFQLKKESRNEAQTHRVFRPCNSGLGQFKLFAKSRSVS